MNESNGTLENNAGSGKRNKSNMGNIKKEFKQKCIDNVKLV